MKQRGMVLPVVLVVLIIIGILAFSKVYISRQQFQSASKVSLRQKALNYAICGLEIGKRYYDAALNHINQKKTLDFTLNENKVLKEFIEKHLYEARDGNPPDFPMQDMDYPLIVDEIQKITELKLNGEKVSIKINLQYHRMEGGLYENSNPGVYPDDDEYAGLFKIQSVATVEDQKNGRSEVVVNAYREFKRVSILPPVVGKFSLFVRDLSAFGQLNNLKTGETPVKINSGNIDPGNKSPGSYREYIEGQGWIFLGWNSPNALVFRLTGGANRSSADYFPLKDCGCTFDFEGPSTYWQLCAYRKFYTYTDLDIQPRKILPGHFSGSPQIDSKSSKINLYGCDDSPRPTLLIGNVDASFLLAQGITGVNDPSLVMPFPNIAQGEYQNNSWAGIVDTNDVTIIKAIFDPIQNFLVNGNQSTPTGDGSNGYEPYSRGMCFVIGDTQHNQNEPMVPRTKTLPVDGTGKTINHTTRYPYNELQLYNLSLGSYTTGVMPYRRYEYLDAASMKSVEDKPLRTLIDAQASAGVIPCRLQVGTDYILKNSTLNKPLFKGDFNRFFDLQGCMIKRVGKIYGSEDIFKEDRIRKEGDVHRIVLGGIYQVNNSSVKPFVIDKRLEYTGGTGGILIVKNSVEIQSDIVLTNPDSNPNNDKEPLSIISLEGNITVASGVKLDASLTALQGVVNLPDQFVVNGFVAAEKLDFPNNLGGDAKAINYMKKYDPTNGSNYPDCYRVMFDDSWLTHIR